MLIDENSSISILIIRLFHLIGVLINYFTLTNGKTQFLLAKLIDGVSFPVWSKYNNKECKFVSWLISIYLKENFAKNMAFSQGDRL